jgi:hypothetical protein
MAAAWPGTFDAAAVYEVVEGRIRTAWFFLDE